MSHGEDDQPEYKVKFYVIPKPFVHHFPGYGAGLAKSEPGGLVMNPYFAQHAEKLYRLEPREDDVWLVTFPKCGTTWTAELLWQVVNNCDFETAAKQPLGVRVPFPDVAYFSPPPTVATTSPKMLDRINGMPSPRVIRPHLPVYMLHPKLLDTCKVVYVARNPKDVIVSFYFHHKHMKLHGFTGDIELFADYFMNDEVMYSPYFPHVLEAWNLRHHPNMHFMFYEDMKRDLRGEVEKVAAFLGKSLTAEQLDKLTEHLKFDQFEKNESVNNEGLKKLGAFSAEGKFCRKGKTGDWVNHFSPELNARIDAWIEKNLAGTDLKFVTELEYQD